MPVNAMKKICTLLLLVSLLVLIAPLFGTINATMQWDVRTTGNDTNGGGFDPSVSVPGTDFSQQDAPVKAYTDIVIGGTTTQITSASRPFSSVDPGNVINVTAGTGCTTGRFEILSVSGATATLDRSMGTAASTCTGNEGGALLTLATAAAAVTAAGQAVNVKAGTYTLTSTVTLASLNQGWIGFSATHNDGGTRPLITTATNSVPLISLQQGAILWKNISMSNTASTRSTALQADANYSTLIVENSKFDGFQNVIANNVGNVSDMSVSLSEFVNTKATDIAMNFRGSVFGSWFHGNSSNTGANVSCTDCSVAFSVFSSSSLAYGVLGLGLHGETIVNNVFYGLDTGIFTSGTTQTSIYNNVFYGNRYGVNMGTTYGAIRCNAFGNNSTANFGVGPYYYASDTIALSADPFISSTDFRLNNAAGGGALLRKTGCSTGAPFGTGYLDVGAVQTTGGQVGYPR